MTTNRESKRIPQTLAELAAQTDEILAELEAEDRAAAKQPRKRILSVTVKREADDDANATNLDGILSDERMESFKRGDWRWIGVKAKAEVQLTGDLCQTITSGGLWGIQSDDSYHGFENGQLDELRAQLHAIGFTKRAVSVAFRNVQHANE